MVVNLCLSHFSTTVQCNKLCADGYDVTNLLSADPALRRRGFKIEYFLRPPVEVTLKFGFQVELCRVDVELWPWGMDKGQACKRLEISTTSYSLSSQSFSQEHKQVKLKHKRRMLGNDQNEQGHMNKSCQSNGHKWSIQAQQWGERSPDNPQERGQQYQSNTCNPEFKLVGRCELREETKVCFTRSNFCPHPPFLSLPPPQPANCRQEEMWSRGLLSLGAVTQLRVTVPFGGAASALGLKSLAVWGQPARCCPAEEVERIRLVHEASERRMLRPMFSASSLRPTKQTLQTSTPTSNLSIPEEFLDPITQEVMTLPMLLPCGVSVDSTTLEEYQKREATWGRPPNDPFTGVPFTSTSHALPNPQLKIRIDQFVLQKGLIRRDGMLGRQENGHNPQASRLITSKVEEESQNSSCVSKGSIDNTDNKHDKKNTERTTKIQDTESGHSSDKGNYTSTSQTFNTNSESEAAGWRKQDLRGASKKSTEATTDENHLVSQAKRQRTDAVSSFSSHEQRLSASLDEALLFALQGRPSFTSALSGHTVISSDSEPQNKMQHFRNPSMLGETTCSTCSCSVSVYSTSASSIYRLTCGHLLCHACLQKETQQKNSVTTFGANKILCATCHSTTPRTDVIRVHY